MTFRGHMKITARGDCHVSSIRRQYRHDEKGNKEKNTGIDQLPKSPLKMVSGQTQHFKTHHVSRKIFSESGVRVKDIFEKSDLLGKVVNIKKYVDSWAAGNWGVIVGFDGQHYHIAINCGDPHLIFDRNEFTVPKRQWYYGYEKHHQNFLDKWGIKNDS